MKRKIRSASRLTVRGAFIVAASCGLACLAGCASSASVARASQSAAAARASASATGSDQVSPAFLPASAFRSPAGTLSNMASAASGTASLPWLLVMRNQSSGVLTIEVVRGGCAEAAEGYVATGTSNGVVLTIVAGIQQTQACEATRAYSLYHLTLPASEAYKALEHATVHDW